MTTAYSSYGTTVDRSSSSYKTKPSTPNRTSSASSSHSSSSSTTPTVLSPPRLTLNGHPIAAPSSAAFPPASPHRKRRSRRDSSGSMSASLKPSRQHDRQQTLPPRRKIKSHTLKHMPNPVLHPHAFLQFVVWRVYLWFQATFVLGMLTDVEVLLLGECRDALDVGLFSYLVPFQIQC